MANAIFAKLKIKPGQKVLILSGPAGYAKATADVHLKIAAKQQYDAIQLFAKNIADVNKHIGAVLKALHDDGLLWISYPKKTSTIKSDLSRDHGWDKLIAAGYEGVSLVSIDETWSAFRFKKTKKQKVETSQSKKAVSESKDEVQRGKLDTKIQVFNAILVKDPKDKMDTAFVNIPFDVEEVYGTNGLVKVKALFDGHPYRGSLANMGTGSHILIVRKDVRDAIKKKVGDRVHVQIQRDTEERVVEMPADLLVALGDNPKASAIFDKLSFTNRKEYASWVLSAKRDETRLKRLRETIEKLIKGKKNPSEK
ncbi:YdeI/OmpD-associated family protein [Pseudochryseolinea flava]|uniref:DUF1905 domain-containing protein n=1 Tax=Pseudochryseolinea flava TaxID=2059302 RepID=A0A364Y7E9_9BACT|nr:YdeI/OmpD-associated family protein [Pseudochryseolinea flava]RAW02823.1 hypothetical protein DQQ10_01565 [Pseudochryseolinea flava]